MKPRGRHPHHKLNAAKVRTLNVPGRYSDGNGLYLEVAPSGAKRWLLRTVVQGRRRDFGLGSVSTVSLAEARLKAAKYRSIARSGGDPVADRNAQKGIPTFEHAARAVHNSHRQHWANSKHAAQWLTSLETYAFPLIGALPVNKIEPRDVLHVLNPIWLPKHETARRVRQRIKTVLDWCQASGFRDGTNPTDSIQKGLPKHNKPTRHHAALPYAKLPFFINALRSFEADTSVKLALEFLILTATRTNETLKATWNEIDGDIWTIPATRMKNKQIHRVPLPRRCVEILEEAKILSTGPYIFPGRQPTRPLSNMALLQVLRRLGLDGQATVHGFRSSFKDWATECTPFPHEVSEAALSHTVRDKTVAAYQRGDIFEKRRALMKDWQDYAIATAGVTKTPPQE
ncbi:tyrosine-type recombinase/integrase [Hyphomicrobium nitrativorans]|uniref:tyrosine-type recombinase/integrase n=1 Tax=Hyphomicrobium nitrativorans TaxID=1427356 RepID=UPI00059D5C5A|nr:integrase arm-type DNA-binding domain-containing protein [Hyphomicrobium nitrativorans]